MQHKNIILSQFVLFIIAITHCCCVLPMLNKLKTIGTIGLAGAAGKYCYDRKKSFDRSYANKTLLYLPTIQRIEPLLANNHISVDASCSPTHNHIVALYNATWPDKSAIESFDKKIDAIVTEYYPDGPFQLPNDTKIILRDTTKLLINNELNASKENYIVYHGTNNTPGILFRTMLNKQINPNTPEDYFSLRDPGTKNPFVSTNNLVEHIRTIRNAEKEKLQEKYTKDYGQNGHLEYVGQLFGGSLARNDARKQINTLELPTEYNNALLSVNRAALANSCPTDIKGSNSFRFLTNIKRDNSIWSFFLDSDNTTKSTQDILEIKNAIYRYGGDPDVIDKHINRLEKLCGKIGGMLIQFEVPKNLANRLVICESFNNPVCSAENQLASMQAPITSSTIREIDYKHLVMPLSVFNDSTNGVRMHAIIHADQTNLTDLLKLFNDINKEIVINLNIEN